MQILGGNCRQEGWTLLSSSGKDGHVAGGELTAARGKDGHMAGEDWQRLADYVVARRVELGMRDRRAFAEATGVTERTLGKLENGQRVSPSTLGMVENRLSWAPGSCRRILAGGAPSLGSPDRGHAEHEDPTLWHLASTPGLPPDVVRGLVALARNWRQGEEGADEQARPRA
jgi:transcriptional regulator with XRE-family HTH domain